MKTEKNKIMDSLADEFDEDEVEDGEFTDEDVIDFLKDNPNPDEDEVRDWAEANGYDIYQVENILYELATNYVKDLL